MVRRHPDAPDNLKYLGGLSLEEHKSLSCLFDSLRNKYHVEIPFFSDSYVDADKVIQMSAVIKQEVLNKVINGDEDEVTRKSLIKIKDIVSVATTDFSGMAIYCD